MGPFHPRRNNRRLSFRRSPRSGVRVACWVGAPEQGRNLALALVDASQLGVRLMLVDRLEDGQQVSLRLEGPQSRAPIERQGTLIWSKLAGAAFRVGIRLHTRLTFAELSELTYMHF
ncbi:MAG: PilZ domain-containing protein [Gemmataceae bacterium]|nr:PilZ domain-containing protein [Gemmataceae bacterium]